MNPIALGCILGHHSLLSITELLSFLGNKPDILAFDREFVLLENHYEDALKYPDSMGGTQKICLIMDKVSKNDVQQSLTTLLGYLIRTKRLEKLTFALSVYGKDRDFQKDAIVALKRYASKIVPAKVRFIHKDLNKNPSTAALLGQKVLRKGVELVVLQKDEEYYIGYTTWVQDIEGYTKRDVMKPRRNMKVGMLPPKLAQTLINLVPGVRGVETLWDPFVGLGTLPMEGLLLGRHVIGTDISKKMVDATEENTKWIRRLYKVPEELLSEYYSQDVRTLDTLPGLISIGRSAIVTEGYLGENFTASPDMSSAMNQLEEVGILYAEFLEKLQDLAYAEPIVITFPFHISEKGTFTRYNKLRGMIQKAGYEIVPLLKQEVYQTIIAADKKWKQYYTQDGTILYTRGKQYVGREILCLRAKRR